MSMLAEPRRKVRYNINPNGNLWANDSSTFGKKMLEKMGWSSGKGLGANLDGMTSHVKVQYKSDQGGVGFKDRNDQWTEHEDNFTELLKNLQSNGHQAIEPETVKVEETSESPIKRKSLELKSKTSKARVHYQKFTRGKDLSRYSSKDLANIFGRKTLEKTASNEGSEESNPGNDSEDGKDKEKEKSHGVDTFHGGSMTDYFKKKMSQFKLTFGTSKTPQSEDEEEDARPSFGMGFSQDSVSRNSPETERIGFGFGFVPAGTEETEKKRKRKSSEDLQQDKPKKKAKKTQDEVAGVSNEAFNDESPQQTEDNCDSGVSLDDNPYEIKPKAKKCKKKNKNKDDGAENVACDAVEEVIEESDAKKSKKKKKCSGGLENPTFEGSTPGNNQELSGAPEKDVRDVPEALNPYEIVNVSRKEKKKDKKDKKKKSKENDGVENPNFDESLAKEDQDQGPLEIEPNPYEVVVKDKKKKKKKTVLGEGIENPVFRDNPIEIDQEQSAEVREKKKKKKMKDEVNDSQIMEENEREINEVEEIQNNGIENPVFRDNSMEVDQEDMPVVKEKKKSKAKDSFTKEEAVDEEGDVKKKKRKSKTEDSFTIEEINESQDLQEREEPVKKKKKKKRVEKLEVAGQEESKEEEIGEIIVSTPITPLPSSSAASLANNFGIADDLILNVSSTDPKPILHTPQNAHARVSRRKSVRIDETLNQERIIPNILQQKQMMLMRDEDAGASGVDNAGFEMKGASNCWGLKEAAQNLLDSYQTEIENDINEGKRRERAESAEASRYIGSGAKLEEHRRLPNGNVELAFKHANLTQTVVLKRTAGSAQKGYRHLVRGDVEVEFGGTNLHSISGYATAETLAKAKLKAAQNPRAPQVPKNHVTSMVQVEKLERSNKLKRK